MAKRFDVVVIGGGPGGYPAAIRAAQLGKSVGLVERGELGGVCLNWGCIPSKAVIHAAELRKEAEHAASFGIGAGQMPVDVNKLRGWKEGILKKLRGGIASLLKANGVELLKGSARFTGPKALEVSGADGKKETVEFAHAIVATGARAIELPFLPRSNPRVWTSEELMELKELPKRLICVGGGVIGMETACSFSKLGCEVTVVELMPALLPGTDPDLVKPVAQGLQKAGVKVLLETKATGLVDKGDHAVLVVETKQGKQELPCDRVLVSIGFRPNVEGIGLEALGVKVEKGFIPVDARCRTNVEHIFAIGDVTGPPYLAHRATKQGLVAAEVIAGGPALMDVLAMPLGVFSDPEVATVGLMEKEAREAGHEVTVGAFPLAALGRAMAQEATAGVIKVIGDKKTGQLLGVGISSARANDLIGEAALALEMGAMVEDLALTVHPHPTFTEGLMEAAEDALGHAIHIARPKRNKGALDKQSDALLLKK